MKYINIFLLLLVIISISSCNTFKVRETIEALDSSITNYNVALRWGMYKEAYSYHYSPDGKQPPIDLDAFEELSITGVEVTEKNLNEKHTKANIETIITYYIKTQGSIRKLNLSQEWWFNAELKQWFVNHPFPKFN